VAEKTDTATSNSNNSNNNNNHNNSWKKSFNAHAYMHSS
jgi:hypothetical protein